MHVLTCLLLWLNPNPRDVYRLVELVDIAQQIVSTDADEAEGETLAAVAIHETGARIFRHGTHSLVTDGRGAFGPWQVVGGPPTAAEALRRVRWSVGLCGDLSLYAGCGRCGACPDIASSLWDPTLPRR